MNGDIQVSVSFRPDSNDLSILNNLYLSSLSIRRTQEQLSSGLKINRAADGPAELVISEKLRSQIASLNQEIENLSMSINKYEYASSSVGQMRARLTELRSLAVGAANEGVNSENMQTAYDTAAQSIVSEYNDLAANAEYNCNKLFDGSEDSLGIISSLNGIDLTSASAAEQSIVIIDEAIKQVDQTQVNIGATQANNLESQRASLEVKRENLIAAESQLRDTDYALQYATIIRAIITHNAGIALLAHSLFNAEGVMQLLST
jgi:flagellin